MTMENKYTLLKIVALFVKDLINNQFKNPCNVFSVKLQFTIRVIKFFRKFLILGFVMYVRNLKEKKFVHFVH